MRRLLTIPISHFCEKARWALERAGLEYTEERHIQGVHQIVAKRAGGKVTMPVLIAPEGVFNESEAIVRYADPTLFDGPEVLELCRDFDEHLGPEGRRWVYAQMLPQKDLLMRFNNHGVPRWEDRMMRWMWPVVKGYASKELGITKTTIQDDEPKVWATFDRVAERLSDGRPYLCCDRFTAADLTFASLSASVLAPPVYGTPLPQPGEVPAHLAAKVEEFRAHPAGAFAMRLFRDERPKQQQ